MYQLSYDEERILVTIVYKGHWTMETFKAYEAEALALHTQISRRHKNYRVLSDITEFSVQSSEVAAAFERLISARMSANKGPLAIVSNGAISKLQAKRITPISGTRIFSNREDALAWLFEDGRLPAQEGMR